MFSTSNTLQHCPHFAGFFIASERLDLDTNDEHQQHHRRSEQTINLPVYAEEGVFAVMDSVPDFDYSPPKYQDVGNEQIEMSHINENSDDSYSSDPDWDNSSDESTEWTEHFSDWGIKLVHMDELLQEKLFEEWLQEKCNH